MPATDRYGRIKRQRTEDHSGCNGTSAAGGAGQVNGGGHEPEHEDHVADHDNGTEENGDDLISDDESVTLDSDEAEEGDGECEDEEEEDGSAEDQDSGDGEGEDEEEEGEEEVPEDGDDADMSRDRSAAVDEGAFENPDVLSEGGVETEKGKRASFDRVKLFKGARDRSKRLIVVLEKANLEIVKVGKSFELLNCDQHMAQIRKYRRDPAFCRPDIVHQCLLMLFDSPLNRAGLLQVYVHTMHNILIEINPQTRFPRTFPRFASLMVQLLYRMSIKSKQGADKLLRVVRNPVTSHLPVGCRKIGTSFKGDRLVQPQDLVIPDSDDPLVVVVGAMAHGEAQVEYTEETVSISNYPLSGALACTKIVSAFESAWRVH